MGVKLKRLMIGITAAIGVTLFFSWKSTSFKCERDAPCVFCDVSILNNQKFYEDDLVIALYTHKPILPGHSLIIPKGMSSAMKCCLTMK